MSPNETGLEAVVYVSACTEPMTSAMLEALLAEARRLNRDSGVTGVLLHADGQFMQYFEGPPDSMRPTYERIRRSRRHTRITELMNEPVAGREFADWLMGLARPSRSDLLALSTADWVVHDARSAGRGRGSVGMALLRGFWSRRRSRP